MSISRIQSRLGRAEERLYKQLPREIVAPANVRDVLINVLGTAFVVLAVNFAARWYLDRFTTNRGYWLVKQKWEILQTMSAPAEWLILGDSSGNQGVVPEVLEDGLGGTAVNLCTFGDMTLLSDVWMLQEYIERFDPPQNVLVVHTYDFWYRELYPVLLAQVPLPWGYWNELSPTPDPSVKDQIYIFLARYVPLYAENLTLADIVLQGIQSPGGLFKSLFHLESDGYMRVMEADPRNVQRDTRERIEFVAENSFSVVDINRAAMNQLVALADRYRIDVFIANGPLYEGLYENQDFQEYLSDVEEELSNFAEQSEHIYYLATVLTLPIDHMQRADHVTHSGAKEYTEMLTLEIMKVQ